MFWSIVRCFLSIYHRSTGFICGMFAACPQGVQALALEAVHSMTPAAAPTLYERPR